MSRWLRKFVLVLALIAVAFSEMGGVASSLPALSPKPDELLPAEEAFPEANYYEEEVRPDPLLSLEEALALALKRGLTVRLAELGVEEARFALLASGTRFDPTLTLGSTLAHTERGGATSVLFNFGLSKTDRLTSFVQWEKPLGDGSNFQIRYDFTKTKIGGGQSPLTGVPTFSGQLTLSYSRPLIAGSGRFVNQLDRIIAEHNLELAKTVFNLSQLDTISQVTTAYLGLVELQEAIRVREASLRSAEELLRRNIERYKVGLGIKSDILEAQNSVLAQRAALTNAVTAYENAKRDFLDLLGIQRELDFRVTRPSLTLPALEERPTAELASKASRFSQRIAELSTQLQNQRLQEARLRNQARTDLRLNLQYIKQGEDFAESDAFSGIDFDSYSLNLVWNFGRPKKLVMDQLHQAQVARERLEEQLADQQRRLRSQVEKLKEEIAGLVIALEAAKANEAAATERLELTKARLRAGLATTFDQLRAEEELLSARLNRISTEVRLSQRRVDLLRLVGAGLEDLIPTQGTETTSAEAQEGAKEAQQAPAGGSSQG